MIDEVKLREWLEKKVAFCEYRSTQCKPLWRSHYKDAVKSYKEVLRYLGAQTRHCQECGKAEYKCFLGPRLCSDCLRKKYHTASLEPPPPICGDCTLFVPPHTCTEYHYSGLSRDSMAEPCLTFSRKPTDPEPTRDDDLPECIYRREGWVGNLLCTHPALIGVMKLPAIIRHTEMCTKCSHYSRAFLDEEDENLENEPNEYDRWVMWAHNYCKRHGYTLRSVSSTEFEIEGDTWIRVDNTGMICRRYEVENEEDG